MSGQYVTREKVSVKHILFLTDKKKNHCVFIYVKRQMKTILKGFNDRFYNYFLKTYNI